MVEKEQSVSIQSKDHLVAILKSAGIPVEEWDSFKGVNDLFEEIQKGETVFVYEGKELIRQVSVARIYVFFTDMNGDKYQLHEAKQVNTDGKERERGFDFVSERFKAGEEPVEAAKRGLGEELNMKGEIDLETGEVEESERTSPSYPGLKSKYLTYCFNLNLSESQYNKEGYIEPDKGLEKFLSHFAWKKI